MATCEFVGNQTRWEQLFEESAQYPSTDTSIWVELGINRGLTSDTEEGKVALAREMGAVMSFVLPLGQTERFKEDLRPEEIASNLSRDPERIQKVVDLMVEVGAIISVNKRRKLARKNERGW